MEATLAKSLLRIAIVRNPQAVEGVLFRAYEWETETTARVLLQLKRRGVIFSESDVELDKVTGCFRAWVDGVECGGPEWN